MFFCITLKGLYYDYNSLIINLLIFMSEKERKHKKAEEFRQRIVMPAQRAAAIRELIEKSAYDMSDEIRLVVLFQKQDYLRGCEQEYYDLVVKVNSIASDKVKGKALEFYRRWHG